MESQCGDINSGVLREMLKNPPLNHNPLIGEGHVDTLINIHDGLSAIQEWVLLPLDEGKDLPQPANTGIYFFIRCMKDALRFEIDQRLDAEAPD